MRACSARENAMCSRPATFLNVQSCCYAVKMSLFFSCPFKILQSMIRNYRDISYRTDRLKNKNLFVDEQ